MVKKIIALIVTSVVLFSSSFAQSDPLELVSTVKLSESNMDLVDFKELCMDDWAKAWTFVDHDKAEFCFIDDNVRMIFYLSGAYAQVDESKNNWLTAWFNSYQTTLLQFFSAKSKEDYDMENIKWLDDEVTKFDNVMNLSYDQKLKAYKLHKNLVKYMSKR